MSHSAAVTKGPKPRLSQEEIVDCALELLDADGRSALNLRALAQRLEISTMAIYRYFENKDDLLDAIVEGAIKNVDFDPALPWDERLEQALRQLASSLHRHAAVAEIAAVRRPGVRLDPIRESLHVALRDGGFSAAESTRALRALSAYVFGFALISTPEVRRRRAEKDFAYGLSLMLDSLRDSARPARSRT